MHREICQVCTGQLVATIAVKNVLTHSEICQVCIGQLVATIAVKKLQIASTIVKGDVDAKAS